MYTFAVLVLLALAVLKVVDFVTDIVPVIDRFRSLLSLILAVGIVVLLDISLFEQWGVDLSQEDLGTWVTGIVVWGLIVPWRAIFGYLTHDKATSDESLGVSTGILHRAA